MARIIVAASPIYGHFAPEIPPGPPEHNYNIQRIFIDPIPAQFAALQEVLASAGDQPTVLISDAWYLGSWPLWFGAAGLRPTATISIGVVPLSLTSVDAPPFGFSMAPDPTEAGRQRNLELTEEIKQAMAPTAAYLRKALRALGATEEPGFIWDDIVALPDRYLQLSPAGFEYPRSDAPKNIRFLGVLPAPTSANEHELPDWWADVERAERVVVVTQGTIANRDLTELIEPALRSLGDLDALVVAATGREDVTIADVPANARVASFIPFDTLLPYTDVLLTNGGFGGVMQAFRHGVPMVLAGDTEDKSENGVHVAWLGAGKNLGTARPDEADIRKAVDQVLGDQSYRHAARRLEAEIASIDTFAVIAAQVDELLG